MKTSGASVEGSTPSESEGSGSSDSSGSTGPGRFEMSSLVFSKSDVVLLGALIRLSTKVCLECMQMELTTVGVLWRDDARTVDDNLDMRRVSIYLPSFSV